MIRRLFEWIADSAVLRPSVDPIECGEGTCRRIRWKIGDVELFVRRNYRDEALEPEAYLVKFSGTGGRAERSSIHPVDLATDVRFEVWCVNPPGYGNSAGPARMRHFAAAADAVIEIIAEEANGRPILTSGNSLGTTMALYLGTRPEVSGVWFRNPPPLRQLIGETHAWWNAGLISRGVGRAVPKTLDSTENAAKCDKPGLWVCSLQDRVVPVRYQRMIADAYAGQLFKAELARADHADPPELDERDAYIELHREWLKAALGRGLVEPIRTENLPHGPAGGDTWGEY